MTPRDERSIAELQALLAEAQGRRLTSLLTQLADDDRVGVQALVEAARARLAAEKRERTRTSRMYAREVELRERGFATVAGLDEVGRGALAGPLTAAAVVLPATPQLIGLNDSKKLTPERREELDATIREHAIAVSVAHISAGEIDGLGMTEALRRVMRAALDGLGIGIDHVLLDGLPLGVVVEETAVVKGDGSVAAIAAASIVAKVTRDALMRSVAAEHPHYGFEVNKGYGTAEHLAAISRFGLCPLHRRSFNTGGGTDPLF